MANTDLIGAVGSLTWVSGLVNDTNAPHVARIQVVDFNLDRGTGNATRPGSLSERVTVGPWRGTLTLRTNVTDDAAMPIPTATVGVVKVGFDAAPTPTKYWTFKVVIVAARGVGYNAASGEVPQKIDYVCRITSTAITDTIVAT